MPDDDRSEGRYSIRAIDRALDVIECIASLEGEFSVDRIKDVTGLPKTTVFRVLATLEGRRFVVRDEARQTYTLGPLAILVGARALGQMDLRKTARPHLEKLMAAAGETVHLSVLSEASALCIDKIDSNRSVRMSSFVGFRDPLHCSGVGKILLSFQDAALQEKLLGEMALERKTPNTITDKERLRAEIDLIRERGYSTDVEEIEDGLCCVAAPVMDYHGVIVAGVSMSGPTTRVNAETFATLIPQVRACAAAISSDLGFRGTIGR